MLYNDGLKPHLSVLFLAHAPMVKLVATTSLSLVAFRRAGSNPAGGILK